MPKKLKVPCKHSGCPRLVDYDKNYCKEHEVLHRNDRLSSYKRGYNSKWRKARKIYLNSNPFCESCKKNGKLTQATVVDHIIPHRGEYRLFWDKNNWQSLCKACHDKKTWREDATPVYKY